MTDPIAGSDRVVRSPVLIAQPRVSIVVPTYDHETYIESTIRSILEQATDVPFEIIVGNDASTDATGEILDRLAAEAPHRLVVVHRARNRGAGLNFLDILHRARGEYVASCDGDDRWEPGKLARQVELLDGNPDLSACAHDVRVVELPGGHELGRLGEHNPIPGRDRYTFADLVRWGTIFGSVSYLYRASTLFASEPPLYPCLDYFLELKAALRGDIGYLDQVLAVYRKNAASSTSRARRSREGTLEIYHHTLCCLDHVRDLAPDRAVLDAGYARIHYTYASELYRRGAMADFRRAIEASVETGVHLDPYQRHLHRWRHAPGLGRLALALRRRLSRPPPAPGLE